MNASPRRRALLEIARAFTQEVTTLVTEAASELGVARTAVQATSSVMAPKVAHELLASVQAAQSRLVAASALQRRLRRALEGVRRPGRSSTRSRAPAPRWRLCSASTR